MVLKVASPSWIGGEEEEGKQAFAHFLPSTALDYSSFYLFLSPPLPQKAPGQMPALCPLSSLWPRENRDEPRLIKF